MIDGNDALLLQEIARRESRSILQYVEDGCFPWVNSAELPSLAKVRELILEEQQSTAALLRFLSRQRLAPPFMGSYPEPFTALNYVGFDYLLPLLVEHQQKGIAFLERDLGRLSDKGAAGEIQKLLEEKRRHLLILKGLTVKQPQAVV